MSVNCNTSVNLHTHLKMWTIWREREYVSRAVILFWIIFTGGAKLASFTN